MKYLESASFICLAIFFSVKFTQSRSSVNLEEEAGRVDHLEHPGVGKEEDVILHRRVILHRVPHSISPGVQEVLRRSSLSMTSANSTNHHPTTSYYFNPNEVTSGGRSASTNKGK